MTWIDSSYDHCKTGDEIMRESARRDLKTAVRWLFRFLWIGMILWGIASNLKCR